MKRVMAVLGCLLAFQPAYAADVASRTAAEVKEMDRAFAKRAATEGTAAAFRDTMDPTEGLAFRGAGEPARGTAQIFAAMGGAAPDPTDLRWVPLSAWGSEGGDMGVTTGDWAFFKKGSASAMVTGQYVTVWRKTDKGQWRCLIDIGEPDAKPEVNAATR